MSSPLIQVPIEKLKSGMVIKSYDGFDNRYQSISKNVAIFLRHNFRDTAITVRRDGKQAMIPASNLRTGDSIVRIADFPPHLKKITLVSPGLIKELRKRGLVLFTIFPTDIPGKKNSAVSLITPEPEKSETKLVSQTPVSVSSRPRGEKLQRVHDLVEKVAEGIELKKTMTRHIEETMDTVRRGNLNLVNIKRNLKILSASSEAMTAIVSLKEAKMAYDHSLDVAVLFNTIYKKIATHLPKRSPFLSEDEILMAAVLHDIGKAKIPKSILGLTEKLDTNSREIQIIRSHPYFGARILEEMNLPDIMVNMAAYHHVKKTSDMLNSYPQKVNWKKVTFETRLLTIVDIYQSLVGKRDYKKSWAPNSAIKFITALAGLEFDSRAWSLFLEAMGTYPVGSMVELNDGSLGFVMNTPEKARHPECPVIALTRNQQGEDLTHPYVIDLQIEKEFKIAKEVDCHSIYGKNAVKVFSSMRVA